MKKAVFLIFVLFSINFWGFTSLPGKFHLATNILSFGLLSLITLISLKKKPMRFKGAILLFVLGIFVNILSAYLNHDQKPIHTFFVFGSYFFILLYFLLHEFRLSAGFLESVIISLAIVFSVFYIIQVIAYPTPIFSESMLENRGTIRIRIKGNGFLILGYFLLLNRFLLYKNTIHILLAGAFFIVLLMGGFRTLTLATLVLSVYMFFKTAKLSPKNYLLVLPLVLLFAGMLQFKGVSNIVDGMIHSSERQIEEGDDNIRLVTLSYFYNDFPTNKSVFLMGSGLPNDDKSDYARAMLYLNSQGIFWVDIGLLGFYIVVGLLTLLGLLWFTLKAIFLKVPVQRLYLKIYFLYLLLVSFTTMEIFRDGIFGVEALGLYLLDLSANEQRSINLRAELQKVFLN